MRKDIREGVQKHMIEGIKPNYAALAKQYGCDYRTVKVAYHEALEGAKRPIQRKKRPSKLDPYKATNEILIAWIRKYKKIISSTFHKGCVRYY